MAVVIPVSKLIQGLENMSSGEEVYVQLKDVRTSFRDKETGWAISGDEIKTLPIGPSGRYSQRIIMAIRAGRFVKVIRPFNKDGKLSRNRRYEDLAQSIINMGGHGFSPEDSLDLEEKD